jgi:Family of unknown function (DUF5522)
MMLEQLVEGIDYYIENGFVVFTAHYLRNRGYCCESGCRHCPYGFVRKNSQPVVLNSDSGPNEKVGH